MLSQLYIENIAVIKKATIDLAAGFNVFTGETGAGKTILVHAINAVLGERTSRDIVRVGEDRAVVSALFTDISEQAAEALIALGCEPEEDRTLLVSREITADGRTSVRINGRPATVSILRQVSSHLVDIHGQHDSQVLLSPDRHLHLVDAFAQLGGPLHEYRSLYRDMCAIRHALEDTRMDESEKARRIDLLTYQIEEIERAALQEGEDTELQAQRELIRNAERIAESLQGAHSQLEGDGEMPGGISQLSDAAGLLSAAAAYLPDFGKLSERLVEIGYELQEIAADVADYLEELEFDPRALDAVERRLDLLYTLKKKYGPELADVIEYHRNAAAELDSINSSEERLQQLQQDYAAAYAAVERSAKAISEQRSAAAQAFIAQVTEELSYLDMASVKLSFAHRLHEPGADGIDDMELMISTNPGEPPKPMAKIASGGELSRIMLSIKNVLAHTDRIETSVFDEIDTGVSGRAAQKIGEKLAQVSRDRQVICVTHLAQVAAYADHHLLISKASTADSTVTSVTALPQQEREKEIARIISGENITELSLQNAREMLALAHRGS